MKEFRTVANMEINKVSNGFVITQRDIRNDCHDVVVFTNIDDLCAFLREFFAEKRISPAEIPPLNDLMKVLI